MGRANAKYAVIFRARPGRIDEEYRRMAERMQTLALEEFGCLEFTSASENGVEIAISYWESEEHIQRWKMNSEHRQAQQLGRERWYQSYSVEVVRITRRYERSMQDE